jgi:hypothetical protein
MQDKETRRTAIYLLVAGMALIVAWEPWYRIPIDQSAPEAVGKKLFPQFTDPLAAKSLEVIRFDENNGTIHPFKVAQVNGVWSIPSHSNYPADAREHMADAATALLDLDVLGVASTSPGDQELYGVITPDPAKLRQGMTGVGTRVTFRGDNDKLLADLVVGKEVKDKPDLRYVRVADKDQICEVQIKTDKLSTKFEDWIEKDLLKLNAFDVRQVELNDYSLEEGVGPGGGIALRMHPRSKTRLSFDDSKSAWTLDEMTEFDEKNEPVAGKLGDDEELNKEKLDGMKTALDDLKIVDVERKPKGLSQDLRASEEFVKDNEARASLITRGFYPVPRDGGQIEIFSSEGEATCTTKDGVRYVLRFGHLAGGEDSGEEKKPEDKDKNNPALNRFLFVMAQFDKSQIAEPKLEPVPGAEDKPAEPPVDEKKEDKESKPETPADKPAEKKTDDASPPKSDKAAPKTKVPQKKTAAEEDETKAAVADKPEAAEKKEEKKEAPPTPEEEKRVAIQKENKRKQDEYNDAVKKGEDKVKELNDRFADWYFIISDDVYKKIHLSRADVVKKKEVKEDKPGAEKPAAVPNLDQPQ